MATPFFSQKHIHELCSAAVTARMSRTSLLAFLDNRFVASLPGASSLAEQLLVDLNELNNVGALSDGSVPLRMWLQNAVLLAGPRVESAVFEAALAVLDAKLTPSSKGSEKQPTTQAQPLSPNEVGAQGAPVLTQPMSSRESIRVYVSAAFADRRFVERLERHLAPLVTNGWIQLWHRGMVHAGENTEVVAGAKLREADLVLLLVSADYLADPLSIEESERAMQLLESKGTRVVPVLARASLWQLAPFGRLDAFPKSGVPLASASSPDDAYGELASHVADIVGDLRARTAVSLPSGDGPFLENVSGIVTPLTLAGSNEIPEGKRISEVFKRNGTPDDTYVDPEQLPWIRGALQELGRGLVVEGPSQIGKSTAVRKTLGSESPLWIDLEGRTPEKAIREAFLDGWELHGHVVIDNAQKLDRHPALLGDLARFVRWLADQRPAMGKVTFIGISDVARRLVAAQSDFQGRFDVVEMNRQKVEKIRELITRGEKAANVRFLHKAEIAAAARGSFHLAQELSYRCVLQERSNRGLREEDDTLKVVQKGPAQEIRVLPDDTQVRGQLKRDLDLSFERPVFDLAKADGHTAAPGACIALLWLLSTSADGRVLLALAKERYPHLKSSSFAWVADGGLQGFLANPANVDVASLVTLSAGTLTAADPRFLYYLGALDFKDLGARAGVAVAKPHDSALGDLEILPQATQASVADSGLLDYVPFAWWHPSAPELRDLLATEYPLRDVVLNLAKTAAVGTGQLQLEAGPAILWNSLLETATSQNKLRALIDAILADRHVAGRHAKIRELIAPGGPAAPNAAR